AVRELVPADLEGRIERAAVLDDERRLPTGRAAERLGDVRQIARGRRRRRVRRTAGRRRDESGRVDLRVDDRRTGHGRAEELLLALAAEEEADVPLDAVRRAGHV